MWHIMNDGIGNPYVYEITEDEQIEILYTGSSVQDCQDWIDKESGEYGYSEQKNFD